MAAGTIVLAHDSGGPKLDIVVEFNEQRTGFLANDVASYSDALLTIFSLSSEEQTLIRTNARESVKRFSDSVFEEKFLNTTQAIFTSLLWYIYAVLLYFLPGSILMFMYLFYLESTLLIIKLTVRSDISLMPRR